MPDSWPSAMSRPFQSQDLSGARTGPVPDGTSGDRNEGLDIFRQAGFAPAPPSVSADYESERNSNGMTELQEFPDRTILGLVYL